MSFLTQIRVEFVTQHLMHELKIKGPPSLHLALGYGLMQDNPEKFQAIQKAYELDIRRCRKYGLGNKHGFESRKLK